MSDLSGPIPPRLDGTGRTQDRRTERLDSAWLIRSRPGTPRSDETLAYDAHSALPVSAAGPTLAILSAAVPAVAESVAAGAGNGRRLYCLAPAGRVGDAVPGRLGGTPPTGVIIRRVREAPVAALLSGGRGWLWMGTDGPGAWRLTLDEEQVAAVRLAFLQLYWTHAEDEAWPGEEGLTWRARGDVPFDLPQTLPDAVVRLESDGAGLPAPEPGVSVYLPKGGGPYGHAARWWIPPAGDGHAELAEVPGEVVWSDLGLPPCATGSRPVALPSTARWSLRISLTPRQAGALANVLGQDPDAVFRTNLSLGEAEAWLGAEGRVWPAGRPEPTGLVGEQVLDAGVVPASSLRAMPRAEPDTWPEPMDLALTARWTWRVGAPLVPKGTSEDPLVNAWRAFDRTFADRVKSVATALRAIEHKEGALDQAVAVLKSALLGFGRSREGLRADLHRCEAVTPSADGPDAAREHLARLTDLADRVKRLGDEVARAEWEANQQAERKRQEDEHAAAQKKARTELAEQEEELEGKQKRLAEIEVELGELAPDKADLPKRDRKARQRKLRVERGALEKRIETLEHRVEQNRATLDRPFAYVPSTPPAAHGSGTGSFVPPASGKTSVPEEALPAVGSLLRAGRERLLAIRRWEELDLGEAEALRLGARLVATQEET